MSKKVVGNFLRRRVCRIAEQEARAYHVLQDRQISVTEAHRDARPCYALCALSVLE